MNDDHKMMLLKALQEHGRTIQKFVDGGTVLPGPGSTTVNTASNPNTGPIGTIAGALGLTNNFQAQGANLQSGTNASQLNNAYTGAQNAIGQQQNFANAVQPGTTQALTSQQALLSALQNQANGVGPNPAQAELAQNTAANVANQAALAAGQRGASSNAGLVERQAAQTGAQTQQNAVGQAATLQAQQQLAAQQQLQAQQAQLVGQGATAVQGVNNVNQNEQGILQGANSNLNSATAQQQASINAANAQTAASNQGFLGNIFGGLSGGLAAGLALAEGGEVPEKSKVKDVSPKKFAAGGITGAGPALQMPAAPTSGPQSNIGQWLSSGGGGGSGNSMAPSASSSPSSSGNSLQSGIQGLVSALAGPSAPAPSAEDTTASFMKSPEGQDYLPSAEQAAPWFSKGGEMDYKKGGPVGGKPKVGGAKNSYKNDTQPALLSPGEIVLPRSVTQSADPVGGAAAFVQALMKKKGQMPRKAA